MGFRIPRENLHRAGFPACAAIYGIYFSCSVPLRPEGAPWRDPGRARRAHPRRPAEGRSTDPEAAAAAAGPPAQRALSEAGGAPDPRNHRGDLGFF